MDQLETHFPDSPCDGVLHAMVLVGVQFSGQCLLPFVRRTIDKVLHPEFHHTNDEEFRVTQILAALFYSDEPSLAIELVKGDASSFFETGEHQLLTLLEAIAYISSADIEAWILELTVDTSRARVSARAQQFIMEAEANRQTWTELRSSVQRFLLPRSANRSSDSFHLLRWLGELAAKHPELEAGLIKDSAEAGSVEEAYRWVMLLSHLTAESAALAALELDEKWGENQLGVISSMFPASQDEGGGMSFSGPFANWRQNFHRSTVIVSKLEDYLDSSDTNLREASSRALHWFERLHLEEDH